MLSIETSGISRSLPEVRFVSETLLNFNALFDSGVTYYQGTELAEGKGKRSMHLSCCPLNHTAIASEILLQLKLLLWFAIIHCSKYSCLMTGCGKLNISDILIDFNFFKKRHFLKNVNNVV